MTEHHDLIKRRRQRRGRESLRLGLLILFFLISAGFGLLFFLNQERFALRTVIVNGNRVIPTGALAAAVKEVLAGRRFWFLRQDRVWFYPSGRVIDELFHRFDRLSALTVIFEGFNTLHLTVAERRPAAMWCVDSCFYLDATGLVFARAPRFSSPPFPVFSKFQTASLTLAVEVNDQPWPRSIFVRLLDLTSRLGRFFQTTSLAEFDVRRVVETASGDYEFHLIHRYRLDSGFRVIIAPRQSAGEIEILLQRAMAVPAFQAEAAARRQLEYLDLRFDGKVFYRYN